MMREEELRERQEKMLQRNKQVEAHKERLNGRPKCISCKTRYARLGAAFCSRCGAGEMINNLRDTLPGAIPPPRPVIVVSAEPSPSPKWSLGGPPTVQNIPIGEPIVQEVIELVIPRPEESKEKYYTRHEIAKMLNISRTTISRWEQKGKVPQPIRSVHNNQCLYTEENIVKLREYRDLVYLPPTQPQATVNTPAALVLPRAMKRTVKINRRIEKVVASRIGSLHRGF